jgi:hypothetical protein
VATTRLNVKAASDKKVTRPEPEKAHMSYSGSWTAIRGKASGNVLRELGLLATRENEEFPALIGADLPNGWYVIIVGYRRLEDPCAPVLAKLSAGCEVVTGAAVESSMASEVGEWKDGSRTWSVTFNPDDSDDLAMQSTSHSCFDFGTAAKTDWQRWS